MALVALTVSGVWNPWPGLWDAVNRSQPISEPDVTWQRRIGGTPKSVTIAGDAVVVEQRTRVEGRSLATGAPLWERKADWAAVAGGGRDSVVAVGKLLVKGYELLDPTTGAALRRDEAAVGVWTYRNLLLDARCAQATDCTVSAWDPRGTRPLWTAFLPGVESGFFADNPDLLGTRRLGGHRIDPGAAGPEPVPALLGFPVDGRVHVLETATGRVVRDVEPAREERLVTVGGRLLRIAARSQDGTCYFSISGQDVATGREVWRRDGLNLRTADNAGCVQREDPQGARNVVVGVAPDARETVVDAYDGRLLWVGVVGEKLLAVDDRHVLARTKDRRSVVGRELGGDRPRWSRKVGEKVSGALTPYAVVLSEDGPSRIVAVDPRDGRALANLRTSANVLAVGPAGMVVGEGREIGYVRFAGAAGGGPPDGGARPPGGVDGGGSRPGDGPGGDPGGGPAPVESCGPKRAGCPDPPGKDG
ncbi:PQQ-binding-like beta-propeller repeat protein [Micromonospora sp. WMMD882]|uniref:outer membrane protein assembly factor BamB family protein n=1 Tax=Micromonospora sp. WMMD882 TaxID=3015151 RepID=UPI00248CFBD6|nr:PQQ-binding-like beta-propeller repeat protein [Micromonospora sp. WMMD882]WBB82503.1 PQQ-binding-like beta-propeller repeat protein [Micromonospora sp. WMMD882]